MRVSYAQTETAESFDDLAARAQAAVDSQPEEAVKLFRKALDLRPSWAEGWLYLAGDLYQLSRYPEARAAFRKGLELAPEKGTAWGFLGLCEYALGDFDQALADIRKGEDAGLGGNHDFEAAVRVHGALILVRSSAFDEALGQLQPLTNFGSNSAAVEEAAGLCALTIPKLPSELSARERPVVDLAGKAQWAAMSRRPEDAAAAYRELVAAYPDEPGVHYVCGLHLMDTDQVGALAEFQKELKAHATHWPAMLVSAFLQTRRGSPETAIQLVQQAVRIVPPGQVWVCHAEMGHAFLAMGRPEKAIPELESAAKAQPNNPQMHFYLEQAYRQAGRRAEAAREKAEFLRLKTEQDPLSVPNAAGPAGR